MMEFLFAPSRYLDPGSGSILLQIIIAAFVGIAFTVKVMWGKISAIFRRGSQTDQEPQDHNPNNPQ